MFEEKLPNVLRRAVRELSETHDLENWRIESNLDSTTVTLVWASPLLRYNSHQNSHFVPGQRSRKSPSKRRRDFKRQQQFRSRRQERRKFEHAPEVRANFSSPPQPLSLLRVESPEAVCGQDVSQSTLVTHGDLTVKPVQPVDPGSTVTVLSPSEQTASKTPASPSPKSSQQAHVDKTRNSPRVRCAATVTQNNEKHVQCALDGVMFVGTNDTKEVLRQLARGRNTTGFVSAWCDGCAEPLDSFESCSKCNEEMPKARHRALLGTVRDETAALHRAIAAGRQEEVQRHLHAGADPDFLQGMQGTALCNAIASNQPAIARWLVQNGCDVNAVDFDQTPPLILAVRKQFVELVSLLLAQPRIQPNACDPVTGQPPLHVAVEQNNLELARLLVQCPKYNTGLRDSKTLTALHLAVELNLPDMVTLLAETGDLKPLFNHDGMLPMHMAAKLGLVDIFEILCPPSSDPPSDKEEEPDETDKKTKKKNKHTAAFVAPVYALDTPNMYSGWTALHLAVAEGRLDMVDYLLKKGASVDLKTSSGATPLLLACSRTDCGAASKLLEAGADPNASGEVSVTMRNRYGVYHMTPLLVAAGSNQLELARCLLEHGADINGGEGAKELPLLTALKCRSTAVACLLLGLPVTPEVTSSPKTDDGDESPASGSTTTSINQAAHIVRSSSDNSAYSWLQEGQEGSSECCLEEHYPSGTSLTLEAASVEEEKAGSGVPAEGAASSQRQSRSQSGQAGDGSGKPVVPSSATGGAKTQPPTQNTKGGSPTLDNVKVSPKYQSSVTSPAEASSSATETKTAKSRSSLPGQASSGKTAAGRGGGAASGAAGGKGASIPEVNVTVKPAKTEGVSSNTATAAKPLVARVDVQYKGETPLHAVAGNVSRGGELCRRLVELGCKVDLRNRRGNTPLHEAVAYSNLGVVEALLEAGSDISIADLDGDTVLHLAAREGDVAVGKLLLGAGADPDKAGEGLDPEETPIRVALDSDNIEFVQLLLEAGCSLANESYLVHLDPVAMETNMETALLEMDAPAIFYEDLDLLIELMHQAHQPCSLLSLCLNLIRGVFRRNGVAGFSKIQQLPLPPSLIDKLMYAHL